MSDDEILEQPWQKEPDPNVKVRFVFLSVDVIGHSKLFTDDMTNKDLLKRHNVLAALRDYVKAEIGLDRADELEWDWAGDGGIFAFPAFDPNLPTLDKAFLTAERIAQGLDQFNKEHQPPVLDVRIVLSQSDAYYYEKKELRRAPALNFAAKLRVPGERSSITVTDDVLKHLDCRGRPAFRRIEMSEMAVYGYIPFMIRALDVETDMTPDPAQAAHFGYRLGVLQFTDGNRESAVDAFTRAITHLDNVKEKHRYFYRTLREFYDLWRTLAGDPGLLLPEGDAERHDHLTMLRSDKFKEFRETHPRGQSFQLLLDMELILEQLDVLAGSPVNDPIGLTSLEICLLLERIGYPRRWHGTAVYDRIQRIKAEMATDNVDHTVDEGCCMCSGVAASCLILDGDKEAYGPLLRWLREQHDKDYCRRRVDRFGGAAEGHHGVHYAAMVLQAFVDNGLVAEAPDINNLLDIFFKDSTARPKHYPNRWMKYLNNSIYDFSTYVFHAFARFLLAGGQLEETRKEALRKALRTLSGWLRHDAEDAKLAEDEIGRIYPARENMGSLALGHLLGEVPEVDDMIIRHNLRRFAIYAGTNTLSTIRRRTIDSNLDRIRKMLEGWLLQIECSLYRRERGWPIADHITESLGISAL